MIYPLNEMNGKKYGLRINLIIRFLMYEALYISIIMMWIMHGITTIIAYLDSGNNYSLIMTIF